MEAVGGDVDTVLEGVSVVDSRLARVWATQYRAAPRNRVRPYARLSDLSADDPSSSRIATTSSAPEHYASDPVNRSSQSTTRS